MKNQNKMLVIAYLHVSSRYKYLTYLQHTNLSNIIPKTKLIELDAFLMKQLEPTKII